MRINFLIIASLLFMSFSWGADRESEWRYNDNLLEVIRDIGLRYDVHFTYDREIVEDVEVDDYAPEAYAKVDEALKEVLSGSQFKYVMLESKYVIIFHDGADRC